MLDPRFEACLRAGRSGSITRAAEELFLSKQAVKKQIDSLEAELGFPLFVRSSRGLTPTESGERFLDGIEQLTAQYRQLVIRCAHSVRGQHSQTLTILLPHR